MYSAREIEGRLPCTMHSAQDIKWPHVSAITVFHVALRWTGAALATPVLWFVFIEIGSQFTGHVTLANEARWNATIGLAADYVLAAASVFFLLGQFGIWILEIAPAIPFSWAGLQVCRFLRALAAMLLLVPFFLFIALPS